MQEKIKSAEVLALEKQVMELEKKLLGETKRLRETIGSWRRKAEGKGTKRECLREGYNAERATHYKVYILDLPNDLAIIEILNIIKNEILPQFFPYSFRKIDFSKKYNGWLLEIEKEINFNMNPDRDFILNYYSTINFDSNKEEG